MILEVPYFPQETPDACAPACLRMALAYRFPDQEFAEADLARRCRCIVGEGCSVDDVGRAARRMGLSGRLLPNRNLERRLEALLGEGAPLLANVQLGALSYLTASPPSLDPSMWHSVLVVGFDELSIYVHDPDPSTGGACRRASRTLFFQAWAERYYSLRRL